jgi:membrane-associated phospholipid phosphatase
MPTPRQIFRSDFAPEWAGTAIIFALCAAWAVAIGFQLDVTWRDGLIVAPAMAAVFAVRAFGSRKFGLIGEYFALTVAATAAFGLFSYLSMTTGRPLVDVELNAADHALGFDWLASFHWLEAHHAVSVTLQFVYNTLIYQGLYFGVLLGLMEKKAGLKEMFWIVFVAGLFTSAGAALFPAFGPYLTYGEQSHGIFLPDMLRLHAGRDLHFALTNLTGVVSFPSFHTTMALIYSYGFRRTGPIGWAIAALNVAMLVSIPFFGGHYLVDMIAGAAVGLASIAVIRFAPRVIAALRLPSMPKEATA